MGKKNSFLLLILCKQTPSTITTTVQNQQTIILCFIEQQKTADCTERMWQGPGCRDLQR